ncbi:hypothetical protein XM38_032040 [Halomicronema hongdechloris C2206]|uniref:Uncharacterized protein n=1 Tax=Halomicronema hongdechloris C2206 TaxID=1641165 RepID=A0A1Z3HPM3_9CYAN|nr:HpsJ family protein [Halomicronema hongdechloris]ASC72249.1 hypothetical protein XM38_032040 [Halomicronema hongdechloris C2206]
MTKTNKTTPDTEQLTQALKQLWKSRSTMLRSISPLRLAGYGLLLLALFDLAEILIPPVLMNPRWEFQAFGQLIERVPVPLIGVGLIFIGGRDERLPWEVSLLKILSWVTLLVGVLYFLLIPLGVVNTIRIDRQNNAQITTQTNEVRSQIEQAKAQLATVSTPEEMQALLQAAGATQAVPELGDQQDISALKNQFTEAIADNEASLATQAAETRSSRRLGLLEKSIKWNLGALVAGMMYVLIWRSTDWARRATS